MELTLNDIFSILYRKIALILAIVLFFSCVFFVYTAFFADEQYTSTVKAYIKPSTNADVSKVSDVTYVRTIVGTYVEVLRNYEFYSRVSESLNGNYTPNQLKSKVSFSQKEDSEIFVVHVNAHSPSEAKRIADAFSDNAPDYISYITGNDNLIIAERALQGTKTGPNIISNVFIGAVLGFAISVIYIFIHEFTKKKVDCLSDITKVYNLPVFGIVPCIRTDKKK